MQILISTIIIIHIICTKVSIFLCSIINALNIISRSPISTEIKNPETIREIITFSTAKRITHSTAPAKTTNEQYPSSPIKNFEEQKISYKNVKMKTPHNISSNTAAGKSPQPKQVRQNSRSIEKYVKIADR